MLADINIVIGKNIISKSEQVSSSGSTKVSASNIQKCCCLVFLCIDVLNKGYVLLKCSNIGCLVDHSGLACALLDITNNAITEMFRDEQNKHGYCNRTDMA